MRRTRLLAAALCCVLCAGLLTGCGSPAEEPAPAPAAPAASAQTPEQPVPAPVPNPTPAPEPEPAPEQLPEDMPGEFYFSSGAGAWGSCLFLERDGSFQGDYSDAEMGDMGEDYPDGTVYISCFSGRFGDIARQEDGSWTMTLEELVVDGTIGEELVEDNIRYVTAAAHGLDGGTAFVLYPPETPVAQLDEEFLSWWPRFFDEDSPETLGCYGLWNVEQGLGFFTPVIYG